MKFVCVLFPGSQRGKFAVAFAITVDLYASAPFSFFIGMGVAFVFSIPIVIGAMVGYILLGRSIPFWLKLVRYTIVWWALSAFLFSAIGVWLSSLSGAVELHSHPLAFLLIAWLALRRWRKESVPTAVA